MSEQFKPGDKVHWTHVSQKGRQISMTRREGTIESIDGALAIVRGERKNWQYQVALARLRLDGQRGQIDDFVDAVRESAR